MWKMSTKSEYALLAMIELAGNTKRQPKRLEDLARQKRLSPLYLAQLFMKLRQKGIVKSFRGPHGGFILTKDPTQITILEIIKAVGEPLAMANCLANKNYKRNTCKVASCCLRPIWSKITKAIKKELDQTTLADLVR